MMDTHKRSKGRTDIHNSAPMDSISVLVLVLVLRRLKCEVLRWDGVETLKDG